MTFLALVPLAFVAAPATAEPTCVFNADRARVQIDVPGGATADIGRTPLGVITEGGDPCREGTIEARTTNVDRIVVLATDGEGSRDVIIDQVNGRFAPGATAEAASSEIEIVVALRAGSTNRVRILGGDDDRDHIVLGTDTVGTHRVNLNASEAGGVDADVRLLGVTSVEVRGRVGNDRIVAIGGRATGAAFRKPVDLNGAEGADLLEGGRDEDRLTGGSRNDRMWGHHRSDRFVADDGRADIVIGGPGHDSCTCDPGDERTSVP